jgi:sodium/potassium/calcium exchanger 6
VATLGALGAVLGLKQAFLGATVLSWGNSLGDLVSDTTVARQGFPSMALAGVFAAPLFTLLCGLGGSFVFQTIARGPLSVKLDAPLYLLFVFLLLNLLHKCTVVPYCHSFTLSKKVGWMLIGFYACFFIVYTLNTIF